jgi:hypothetical protein
MVNEVISFELDVVGVDGGGAALPPPPPPQAASIKANTKNTDNKLNNFFIIISFFFMNGTSKIFYCFFYLHRADRFLPILIKSSVPQ